MKALPVVFSCFRCCKIIPLQQFPFPLASINGSLWSILIFSQDAVEDHTKGSIKSPPSFIPTTETPKEEIHTHTHHDLRLLR